MTNVRRQLGNITTRVRLLRVGLAISVPHPQPLPRRDIQLYLDDELDLLQRPTREEATERA